MASDPPSDASHDSSAREEEPGPVNLRAAWAVLALVAAATGLMVYSGDYRNAAWLGLIGLGGGLTLRGRRLDTRGESEAGTRWQRAGAVAYAVVGIWALTVLVRGWIAG